VGKSVKKFSECAEFTPPYGKPLQENTATDLMQNTQNGWS